MGAEAYVQLECPNCGTHWEDRPHELPELDAEWECPSCGDRRNLSEFLSTPTDMAAVEQFHEDRT